MARSNKEVRRVLDWACEAGLTVEEVGQRDRRGRPYKGKHHRIFLDGKPGKRGMVSVATNLKDTRALSNLRSGLRAIGVSEGILNTMPGLNRPGRALAIESGRNIHRMQHGVSR